MSKVHTTKKGIPKVSTWIWNVSPYSCYENMLCLCWRYFRMLWNLWKMRSGLTSKSTLPKDGASKDILSSSGLHYGLCFLVHCDVNRHTVRLQWPPYHNGLKLCSKMNPSHEFFFQVLYHSNMKVRHTKNAWIIASKTNIISCRNLLSP